MMREAEATVSESPEPSRVYHLALGFSWTVHAVLDQWTHPGFPARTYGRAVIARRLRLRVSGPLPGRPRQRGEFVMIATMYGTGYHWWIRPEQPGR